jgi:predicted lipoprotein with Yx(FWY)xxD motif
MTVTSFPRIPAVTMLAGLGLLAAACGSSSSSGSAGASAQAAAPAASGTVTVKQAGSHFGPILTTSNGMTLYVFTSDGTGKSVCTGGCASIWPPLTVAAGAHLAVPHGVHGVTTITRQDGSKQVAIDGHPLYTYASDTAPGQVKGEGVQGTWFVVSPAGAIIRKAATATAPSPSSSSAGSGGGGGYGY